MTTWNCPPGLKHSLFIPLYLSDNRAKAKPLSFRTLNELPTYQVAKIQVQTNLKPLSPKWSLLIVGGLFFFKSLKRYFQHFCHRFKSCTVCYPNRLFFSWRGLQINFLLNLGMLESDELSRMNIQVSGNWEHGSYSFKLQDRCEVLTDNNTNNYTLSLCHRCHYRVVALVLGEQGQSSNTVKVMTDRDYF